ncbi:hypothetical protein M405DRAFT_236429 [Rhizopogon salebrosus TDB-379]|nr:hypothetical protein M405DRAFT_236429 [Rhizopogon salebrosus TDB-379]
MSLQFVSFTVSIITPAGNRSTLAATTGLPRGFFGDSESTHPPRRVAHAGSQQPAWHSRVKDFVFLCPGSHNKHSLRKHVYAALTESSSS